MFIFVPFKLGKVELDVGHCKMDGVASSSLRDLGVQKRRIVKSTPYCSLFHQLGVCFSGEDVAAIGIGHSAFLLKRCFSC